MKSFLIMVGSVLLSGPALPSGQQNVEPIQDWAVEFAAVHSKFNEGGHLAKGFGDSEMELDLAAVDEIVFLEEEPELDLGFDTKDYLPEDFDSNEFYFDLNSIKFLAEEPEVELGFDSRALLSEGFDPYTDVVGIGCINFMEEDQVELGFDPREYLPDGFSPYDFQLDLDSIHFMKVETEIDLGPEAKNLLPEDFDPYTNVVALQGINFMESEEIELGFDTSKYLPKGFDPYFGSKQ